MIRVKVKGSVIWSKSRDLIFRVKVKGHVMIRVIVKTIRQKYTACNFKDPLLISNEGAGILIILKAKKSVFNNLLFVRILVRSISGEI